MNVILEVSKIEKNFPGVKALKGVDFDVREGEVHALCGENGAGKSTLMHILAGVIRPCSGGICYMGGPIHIHNQKHANDLGIAIVYQERSLVDGLSVAENIYAARQPVRNRLGMIDWKRLNSESKALLDSLGIAIDPETQVGRLSPAMQQMVEIAKALSIQPKILILDEPTATITEKEVGALFDLLHRLKKQQIAIIYISHRLSEIFQIADRVTVFKDGESVETADVMDVSHEWLVSKMVGRDLVFDRVERPRSDRCVLEAEHLTGKLFRNASFRLYHGEILGFSGLAGAGRTELMRAVFGADPILSGGVRLNGKAVRFRNSRDAIRSGIGYLPEDRKAQGLFLDMAISANIASASLEVLSRGLSVDERKVDATAEEYVKRLRIMTPGVRQKVVNLSGGNQQKVVLAKWLKVNPSILIVDEPTRGVDVGAKAEIYTLLRGIADAGTSVILVSSDLPEVLALSDRILVMHEGRITGEIDGPAATEELVMKYASGLIDDME